MLQTLWPRYLCPNPWPDTSNRQELVDFLNRDLTKRNPCRLHVSQAILTPGKGTVVRHFFSSLKNSVAKPCDETVSKWLLDQSGPSSLINIVIVDFFQFENLPDTIIRLNRRYQYDRVDEI